MNLPSNGDLVDINADNPPAGEFQIQCMKCGSYNCEIENNMGMGSSGTGAYGSIDIECKTCGNIKPIVVT